jgi:hypothetical protein
MASAAPAFVGIDVAKAELVTAIRHQENAGP